MQTCGRKGRIRSEEADPKLGVISLKGRRAHLLIERIFTLAMAVLVLLVGTAENCSAEIAGDDAFEKISWQHAFSVNLDGGGFQGFCVTDDRIIFIENTSSVSTDPDKVYSYYLNDTDRYGNPVTQYSFAGMRNDDDWEHGNSLTYNPVTNRVYVAFATNLSGYYQGCIGVMNPETLGMVDVIQLSEDYRILGISYIKERDVYLVQTETEGGFRFVLFDSNFNMLQDFAGKSAEPGYTFQGMCVTEDYVLVPPALKNITTKSYTNVFSLREDSVKPLVTGVNDLGLKGYKRVEAEAIAEIGPGRYMMNVFAVNAAGEREYHFYTAEVPYYYNVTVRSNLPGAETGTFKALRGGSFEVPCAEDDKFMLGGITVDGTEMGRDECSDKYTFENIQSDHTIEVSFVDRYPAAANFGNENTEGTVVVNAASVNDVYGELGMSTFGSAVTEVNDSFSDISMGMVAMFVGGIVEGGRFVAIIGKGVSRSVVRGAVSVSDGIMRHKRILTRTCSTLLMLGGLFGLLVLRVRIIRRRKMAHAKIIRKQLKEKMEKAFGESDSTES